MQKHINLSDVMKDAHTSFLKKHDASVFHFYFET